MSECTDACKIYQKELERTDKNGIALQIVAIQAMKQILLIDQDLTIV